MFDLALARPETEVNIHNKLIWLVTGTSMPTLPLPTVLRKVLVLL